MGGFQLTKQALTPYQYAVLEAYLIIKNYGHGSPEAISATEKVTNMSKNKEEKDDS